MSWLRRHPAVSVWSYRARAAAWVAIGVWSFRTGQQDSVTLVWVASLYANVATDLGGAAAADDREVICRLDRIEAMLSDRTTPGGDDR